MPNYLLQPPFSHFQFGGFASSFLFLVISSSRHPALKIIPSSIFYPKPWNVLPIISLKDRRANVQTERIDAL